MHLLQLNRLRILIKTHMQIKKELYLICKYIKKIIERDILRRSNWMHFVNSQMRLLVNFNKVPAFHEVINL